MKLAIHGGLHLYSSLPEAEQTFARRCIGYRDRRVGNPQFSDKRSLGEIFFGATPAKLPLASFTALHIFPDGAFDESQSCDLERLWRDEDLLAAMNVWKPPRDWRSVWRLEKRFNRDGLLLFHEKIDYCQQYIQFFETGIVEAVDHGVASWSLHHSRVIPARHWEDGILRVLDPLMRAVELIGGKAPVGICLSVRDELEYASVSYEDDTIQRTLNNAGRTRLGIKSGLLTMPVTIADSMNEDIQSLLKPSFNALARAGGLPGSPRYPK